MHTTCIYNAFFFPVAHFLFSFEIFSFNCFPIAHALWFISQLLVRIKLKMHSSTSYFSNILNVFCPVTCLPLRSPQRQRPLCVCVLQGLTNSPFRERVGSNRLPEKRPRFLYRIQSTHISIHTRTQILTHTHAYTWYASVNVSLRLRAELLLTLVRRWDEFPPRRTSTLWPCSS